MTRARIARSAAVLVAAAALLCAGAGTAAADSSVAPPSSSGSSGGAGSSGSEESSLDLSRLEDLGVQVGVDTGSLGDWDVTGSLGVETSAPGLRTEIDDAGRMRVWVTRPQSAPLLSTCTPVLVDARHLPELVDTLDDPSAILGGGLPGVTLFAPPIPFPPSQARDYWQTRAAVEPGVHVLAGVCLPQGTTHIAALVMTVPGSGWGSVAETAGFGSQAGSMLIREQLGSVTDSAGSGTGSNGSGSDSGSGS